MVKPEKGAGQWETPELSHMERGANLFLNLPVIKPRRLSFIHEFGERSKSTQPTGRKQKSVLVACLWEIATLTDIARHGRKDGKHKCCESAPIEAFPVPVDGVRVSTVNVVHYTSNKNQCAMHSRVESIQATYS